MLVRDEVQRPFFKVFGVYVNEDFADKPMEFHSERELRDYCNKNNVSCGALL